MNIHERLLRMLIRRRPDLKYSEEYLKGFGTNIDELKSYVNVHPELLDTSDDDSLANFSKRLRKCFSTTKSNNKKVTLTIEGPAEQVDELRKALAYISWSCLVGHSDTLKFSFDGDGNARVSITENGDNLDKVIESEFDCSKLCDHPSKYMDGKYYDSDHKLISFSIGD